MRHRPRHLRVELVRHSRARLHAKPDRREERVRRHADLLERSAGSDRPLDADRRRLAELDCDPELVRERRFEHLLLHFAVEANRKLLAQVVLPDADQRVLLGEPGERIAEGHLVALVARCDHGLERRRREMVSLSTARRADRVSDLDLGQAPELRDLAGGHRRPLDARSAVLEDPDCRDLLLGEPVSRLHGAGEHPDVGDLLPGRAALDLEDASGDGPVAVARRGGQQLGDPAHQRLDAVAGSRRAEEDRIRLGAELHRDGPVLGGLDRNRRRRQPLPDLVEYPRGVGALPVHLVHEQQRRHL